MVVRVCSSIGFLFHRSSLFVRNVSYSSVCRYDSLNDIQFFFHSPELAPSLLASCWFDTKRSNIIWTDNWAAFRWRGQTMWSTVNVELWTNEPILTCCVSKLVIWLKALSLVDKLDQNENENGYSRIGLGQMKGRETKQKFQFLKLLIGSGWNLVLSLLPLALIVLFWFPWFAVIINAKCLCLFHETRNADCYCGHTCHLLRLHVPIFSNNSLGWWWVGVGSWNEIEFAKPNNRTRARLSCG